MLNTKLAKKQEINRHLDKAINNLNETIGNGHVAIEL